MTKNTACHNKVTMSGWPVTTISIEFAELIFNISSQIYPLCIRRLRYKLKCLSTIRECFIEHFAAAKNPRMIHENFALPRGITYLPHSFKRFCNMTLGSLVSSLITQYPAQHMCFNKDHAIKITY